jgi:Zn-dependent peptidase ImmA (M78 family)
LVFPKETSHKEMEKLCHVFASAVLLPEEMARKELSEKRFHFYERELVLLKERWGISIAAIFFRALQLDIISEHVYRKFSQGYRERGYAKLGKEPGSYLSKEKPVLVERLVYMGLAKEMLTYREAARFLNRSVGALNSENMIM